MACQPLFRPWTAIAVVLALGACKSPSSGKDTCEGERCEEIYPEGQTCLRFKSWDVLFTNPECALYAHHDSPMATVEQTLSCRAGCAGDDGCAEVCIAEQAASAGGVKTKPLHTYCTKGDKPRQAGRALSPQTRILEWIRDTRAGDELFLAYLSFSDQEVGAALCEAINRGVSVDFILSKPSCNFPDAADCQQVNCFTCDDNDCLDECHLDVSQSFLSKAAQDFVACGGNLQLRGHVGSLGFAHDKVMMVNPKAPGPADADPDHMRLSFGSGNMTSGTALHHENWQFVEVARNTFFAQFHAQCLRGSLLERTATLGTLNYRNFVTPCRRRLVEQDELTPEDDIEVFLIPDSNERKAAEARLLDNIKLAGSIDLGAHRFSHGKMIAALTARLAEPEFRLRMVADDDLYWIDPEVGPRLDDREVPNKRFEADRVAQLQRAGSERFEIRYLQTSNAARLLHHNKFLLYKDMTDGRPDTLLFGSPNLTGTGFKSNLENVYVTTIPSVVAAFGDQFARFWDGEQLEGDDHAPPRATPIPEMPNALINLNEGTEPDLNLSGDRGEEDRASRDD